MPHLLRATRAGALDPVDRASEVIFGLLMATPFVGTRGVVERGREDLRTLLGAALGCNLAWGALATLFIAGAALARYSGGNPWRLGLLMTAIGALLLVVLVLLGG